MKKSDVEHKIDNCSNCGYEFDCQSEAEGEKGNRPREGDFTICLNCSNLMVIKANGMTRNATSDESKEAMINPNTQDGVSFIKQRGLLKEVMNERFKTHLLEKRGFLPMLNCCIKVIPKNE